MAITHVIVSSMINGLATDVTSVKLRDQSSTYGAKRTDTGAVVVAANTPLVRVSPGVYEYEITDLAEVPAGSVALDYVLEIIYAGVTRYYPRVASASQVLNHIYSIPTPGHYSSQAEVMRWLGEATIELMLEDWEQSDSSPVWNQILTTVDARIDQYCGQYYLPAAIVSHPLIRAHATVLTAHFLSMRRGNPGLYLREVERVYASLEDIASGKAHVPQAVPLADFRPVVRNYLMHPFSMRPARVIQSKSTGVAYGREDWAWEPYFFYW